MSDSYKTVARESRVEIKIKRSRFIGTVRYLTSVESAREFIDSVSGEFYDATHNCWAYRIGLGQVFKYNDDGEPSGTAGKPILDAIDRYDLVDTCVVVTRYYGGIKLGTGGLSRAYRDTALAVVEEAGSETRYLTERVRFTFHLQFTNIVLRTLSSEVSTTVDSEYSDVGKITCDIRRDSAEKIKSTLISQTNGRIDIEEL